MNTQEIIESGLLEAYVLGNASAKEVSMVQSLCRKHPELLIEIEAIERTLMNDAAGRAPALSADLEAKIASRLNQGEAKLLPLNKAQTGVTVYKFGMAASLLLFATSLLYNVLQHRRLNELHGELALLNADKSVLAQQMQIQQTSLETMNYELQVLAHPMVKTVALKGMNSMNQQSAMVHWNTETNEVFFHAATLPKSPENKQYQLWAIVEGKPVDMGMIDPNSVAKVFQKMKSIKGAQAFAVTIENMGGSPVPSMETMCLLGNV